MSTNKNALHWPGIFVLLGAILLAAATALHPVVVDPMNASVPLHHVQESRWEWMADHTLMTIALVLWLAGLSECARAVRATWTVSGLFGASLSVWLLVLSFELGGIPILAERMQEHAEPAIRTVFDGLFASSLIGGYIAMVPAWLGVTLTAGSSASIPGIGRWFARIGILGGMIGTAGIVYCLLLPSVWVLLATTAIPYGWTLIFGWKLRKAPKHS